MPGAHALALTDSSPPLRLDGPPQWSTNNPTSTSSVWCAPVPVRGGQHAPLLAPAAAQLFAPASLRLLVWVQLQL